jgi:cytochrome c-type biogenesis protein CcmH
MKRPLLCLLFALIACSVNAQEDIYRFSSEKNRASFEKLTQELRCPKCLNQNLAGSESEISKIMRDVIAEEIEAGQSEIAIKQMMVDRYSEFVLYDPPVKKETMLLWAMPIVMIGIGLIAFIMILSKRRRFLVKEAQEPSENAVKSEFHSADKLDEHE